MYLKAFVRIYNGFNMPTVSHESNQQDATIQFNLLFLVSSTCFGRCFSHHQEHLTVITVSGSTLFTQVAAGWCLG
jgi:hypothetical protein